MGRRRDGCREAGAEGAVLRTLAATLLVALGFATLVTWSARAEFDVPDLTSPVIDRATIIDPQTEATLSQALRDLQASGGSQITVLTVSSLEGLPIEQASIRVVEQWKLGGEKTDNGVLFLIAPKEHRMRIEVGQGLEGALTDVDSKRIIDDEVAPLFRAGEMSNGILVGVYRIVQKTDPGFDMQSRLEGRTRRQAQGSGGHLPARFWIFLLIALFLFIGRGGGRRRSFLAGGLGGYALGRMSRGGGGWSSGGGGGGWSGGGGGFSGGGASGSW